MAEILPSSLLGSIQIQSVATSAATTQTHPHISPEIANLPQGSLLKGFVVNRDAQGNPILRTERGDLLVKSEVFLKTGSEVVIRLSAQSGQTNARIVSVDNIPLQTLINQQQLTTKGDLVQQSPLAIGSSQNAAASTAQQPPMKPVEGVLLQLKSFGSEAQTQQTIANILRLPAEQLPQLQQGMKLQFRVLSGALTQPTQNPSTAPAPMPTAPGVTGATGQLTSTQYGAYTKLPAPAPLPGAPAQPASVTPTAPPPSSQHAGMLSAKVIGNEGGETILRTSIGTLKLFTPSAPPIGSNLQLELIPFTSTPVSGAGIAPTETGSPPSQLTVASQLSHEWDSLKQGYEMLRADSPAQAQQLAERLPNTKSGVVNNVLFFISALRGNDLQRWFGSNASSKLEERAPRLMQRISNDFNNLRLLSADQPDQNWQMLLFPLIHEDELHQARLYMRHDEGKSGTEQGDETRFIVEVTLSELGELQIDGLMHGARKSRQFDLVIRSQQPLEEAMQSDLRGLYHNAAQAVGFSGQLRFASGTHNLLQPLQEIRQQRSDGDDGSILA